MAELEPLAGGDDPIGMGDTYRDRMRAAEAGKPIRTATVAAGGSDTPDDDDASAVDKAKGLWAKLSARPGIAHLMRAAQRFTDRLGNQFGAAITYFSFLSVVPILMVAFAVASFALKGNQEALDDLKQAAQDQIPGPLTADIIDSAIRSGLSIGIVGLVIALYSGVGWMGNVRDAVQAQWRLEWSRTSSEKKQKFYVRYGKDLLTLIGLGLGMLVSVVLTTVGGAAQSLVLDLLGLDEIDWLRPVFSVVPFLLAIAASTLLFGWFFRMVRIPEYTPSRRTLFRGSLAAAVGFEVLKVAMTFLIPQLSGSPTFAVFGTIIILLFFFNLVARMVLFVSAWIGTAPKIMESAEELPEIPGPALNVHHEVGGTQAVGLIGAGAAAGFLAGRRSKAAKK